MVLDMKNPIKWVGFGQSKVGRKILGRSGLFGGGGGGQWLVDILGFVAGGWLVKL